MSRELVEAYIQDDESTLADGFTRSMRHVGLFNTRAVLVTEDSTARELANNVLGSLVTLSDVHMRKIHLNGVIEEILNEEQRTGAALLLRRDDLMKSEGVNPTAPRTVLLAHTGLPGKASRELGQHLKSGVLTELVKKPFGMDIYRAIADIARRINVTAALKTLSNNKAS